MSDIRDVFTLLINLKLNWYDNRETKKLIRNGEYAPQTTVPSHILDLGAHKGFATKYFARYYPEAIIHAYEPNLHLFKQLQQNTRQFKNVSVFCEAIADHDGVVPFGISQRVVSSSIYLPQTTTVPCVSLSTAVERIGAPVFIKMDIEGAEYDALKCVPNGVIEIVGEVHPEKAQRPPTELFKLLTDFHVFLPRNSKCVFRAIPI